MAFVLSTEETRLIFSLTDEPPIKSFQGPDMDPESLVILLYGDLFHLANVEGPLRLASGERGKRKGSAMFIGGRDAPAFLVAILAARGLTFRTDSVDDEPS